MYPTSLFLYPPLEWGKNLKVGDTSLHYKVKGKHGVNHSHIDEST